MLRRQVARLIGEASAEQVAAAFYDYETETAWSYHGDRWFHAASTIKVAILIGLFEAIEGGRLHPDARLHVRNRFLSVVDGEPYRVAPGRDANAAVHAVIGKTMKVQELARHMIVTSSNLATNLLIDLLGAEAIQQALHRFGIEGVEVRRGVEDERGFEAGINNRVTAHGLLALFRLIHEQRALSPASCEQMLDILAQQEFKSGIPAGLPEEVRERARIAHKTGEISTVAHDAGLVFLPGRQPYAVVILTEWAPEASGGRQATVAETSRLIYEYIVEQDLEKDDDGRSIAGAEGGGRA